MDRVGDAFVWPFRDPQWLEKLAIIGLILLIPIVGAINAIGWMLATIDRLRAGEERLPPANFSYLGRGFELFVALILLITQGSASGNTALALVGVALTMVAFAVTVIGYLGMYFVRPAVVLATLAGGIGGGLALDRVLRRVRESPINTLIAGLMLIAAGFIGGLGAYACFVGIIFTIPFSLAMEAWIIRSYELGATAPAPQEGLNVGHSTAPRR